MVWADGPLRSLQQGAGVCAPVVALQSCWEASVWNAATRHRTGCTPFVGAAGGSCASGEEEK